MYRNKAEKEKTVDLTKYKVKSENLRESEVFKSKTYWIGKKGDVDILDLYDRMGFSENSVMCGECGHRGTLQKKGNNYQVVHTQVKNKKACYFGKDILWNVTDVPVRVILNPKK